MKLITRHSSFIFYLALMSLILVIDVWGGNQINLWFLYCGPIGLAAWNLGKGAGFVAAFIGAVFLGITALVLENVYTSSLHHAIAYLFEATPYFVLVVLVNAMRSEVIHRAIVPPKSQP